MSHSLTNAVVGMNGFPVDQVDNRVSVLGARVRIGTKPISSEKHKAKLTTFGIKNEMSRIISDIEIQQLLAEPKPLPPTWENRLRLIAKA